MRVARDKSHSSILICLLTRYRHRILTSLSPPLMGWRRNPPFPVAVAGKFRQSPAHLSGSVRLGLGAKPRKEEVGELSAYRLSLRRWQTGRALRRVRQSSSISRGHGITIDFRRFPLGLGSEIGTNPSQILTSFGHNVKIWGMEMFNDRNGSE